MKKPKSSGSKHDFGMGHKRQRQTNVFLLSPGARARVNDVGFWGEEKVFLCDPFAKTPFLLNCTRNPHYHKTHHHRFAREREGEHGAVTRTSLTPPHPPPPANPPPPPHTNKRRTGKTQNREKMCVVYVTAYSCGHDKFLDDPPFTQCDKMAAASSSGPPGPPGLCRKASGRDYYVAVPSDNVCATCSGFMFGIEKQFAGAWAAYQASGGRQMQEDIAPLTELGAAVWARWRVDRERFRAVGVDGGEGGELGQGWQLRKIDTPAGGDGGGGWMSARYGPRRMLGWKEDLGFDGFLGEMGDLDPDPEFKGLHPDLVRHGVGPARERTKEELVEIWRGLMEDVWSKD